MNTKKISFLVGLFSTTAIAPLAFAESDLTASTVLTPSDVFSGWHVTGSIGHGKLEARSDTTIVTPAGHKLNNNGQNSKDSMVFDVSTDYTKRLESVLIGFEAGLTVLDTKVKTKASQFTAGAGTSRGEERLIGKHVGFAGIILGKQISEATALYAGIACTHGEFHYKVNRNGDAGSKKISALGIQPSIGIRTKLSNRFMLDARYRYAYYKSQKLTGTKLGVSTVHGKVRPGGTMLTVGLTYKIN